MFFLVYRHRHFRKWLVLELMSHPACRRTIETRQRITIDRAGLASCAEGSLGRALLDHMAQNGLAFVAPFDAPAFSDAHYAIHRILVTHDVYHVVLGVGTSEYGEAIVAAFTTAQISCYAPAVIYAAAGSLRCALVANPMLETSLPGTVIGYLLGKSSHHLFNVDWDRQWSRPLAEVRRELRIDLAGVKAMVERVKEAGPEPAGPGRPRILRELLNDDTCRQEHLEPQPSGPGGAPAIPIQSYRPGSTAVASVILAPALAGEGDCFDRMDEPSLAACLVRHGLRVLVPRIPEADGDRFTLTLEATEAFIEHARGAEPDRPVFLLGHGISGLAFLVHQGLAPASGGCAGVITLGTGAGRPGLPPLPRGVPVPTLSVASDGDQVASPTQVRELHARLGAKPSWLLAQGLGHLDLGASEQAWALWEQIAAWILATASAGQSLPETEAASPTL